MYNESNSHKKIHHKKSKFSSFQIVEKDDLNKPCDLNVMNRIDTDQSGSTSDNLFYSILTYPIHRIEITVSKRLRSLNTDPNTPRIKERTLKDKIILLREFRHKIYKTENDNSNIYFKKNALNVNNT